MTIILALFLNSPVDAPVERRFDFQEMLDSAQLVVIAKVDSIWYPIDPKNGAWTHIMAELLTVYVKDTSFIPRSNHVEIAYYGGRTAGGGWVYMSAHPHFTEGEIFLAALQHHPFFYPKGYDIYHVPVGGWKFTITNDSLFGDGGIGREVIPLGKALGALPNAFIQVQVQQ